MATVEEDYKRPLKEIYDGLPEKTQRYIDSNVSKVWKYFAHWCVSLISAIGISVLITCVLINEPIGKQVQRVGAIIPFLAVLGESLFIVKIDKLASVVHPAQLTCEIYMQRKFKILVKISITFTFLLVGIGAILSGYGDLLTAVLQTFKVSRYFF